ncbi:unnamed protein product [Urochloa humidicola]
MPPARARRGARPVPANGGSDRISKLPDALLHHVLSFLPAQEAVRTSVLAQRWRDLWKHATALRIVRADETLVPQSAEEIREFVYHLLLLRSTSRLDTFELDLHGYDDDDVPRLNLWIRHAVRRCNVRELILDINRDDQENDLFLQLDELPLVSRHLTRLDLAGVSFNDIFMDFSRCPTLEELEITSCNFLGATRVFSQSLKRLTITESYSSEQYRTRICVPGLVSLHMDDPCEERTPVLDRMPDLESAYVNLDSILDSCGCDNSMDYCRHVMGYQVVEHCGSVLLRGLSEARHLVLKSSRLETFIFRRDLRWCPTFGRLRTLLLNDYWCTPTDLRALSCILQHSPVLEKLTLQLSSEGPKHKVEIEGSPNPTEIAHAIPGHLKIVEIKCEVVDAMVLNALGFLSELKICK